jgi:hypothetical protein
MVLWQITGADAVSERHASVFEERCRPARLFNRCGEREEKQEAAERNTMMVLALRRMNCPFITAEG